MQFVFDERFAEGFFHDWSGRRVFGMQLKPFSYRHKVQLEYAQSKLLMGVMPSRWDIWVAAQICSTQYPVNVQFNKNPSSAWYFFWWVRYGWRSFIKNLRVIESHISDFASGPKLWSGKGSSKRRLAEAYKDLAQLTGDISFMQKSAEAEHEADLEGGNDRDIDDSIEQVSIFMKHSGCSAKEAWNTPMGALLWYNACFLKMEGATVPIWSPNDEAHFEQHKKQRHLKILGIAEEIRKENPVLTENLSYALASVQYWEDVIEKQAVAMKR